MLLHAVACGCGCNLAHFIVPRWLAKDKPRFLTAQLWHAIACGCGCNPAHFIVPALACYRQAQPLTAQLWRDAGWRDAPELPRNAEAYRTRDIRRGHALDLQESGVCGQLYFPLYKARAVPTHVCCAQALLFIKFWRLGSGRPRPSSNTGIAISLRPS